MKNCLPFFMVRKIKEGLSMNKISVKVSLFIFGSIFLLMLVSILYIHDGMVEEQMKLELNDLLQQGESYRDVLEVNMDEDTLNTLTFLESDSANEIIVVDESKDILTTSTKITGEVKQLLYINSSEIIDQKVAEDDWKNKNFIASIRAYEGKNGQTGYIYVLMDTYKIRCLGIIPFSICGLNG